MGVECDLRNSYSEVGLELASVILRLLYLIVNIFLYSAKLNQTKPIIVQTFDETVLDGLGARTLYLTMGFKEVQHAGVNLAGLPTIILKRYVSSISN